MVDTPSAGSMFKSYVSFEYVFRWRRKSVFQVDCFGGRWRWVMYWYKVILFYGHRRIQMSMSPYVHVEIILKENIQNASLTNKLFYVNVTFLAYAHVMENTQSCSKQASNIWYNTLLLTKLFILYTYRR